MYDILFGLDVMPVDVLLRAGRATGLAILLQLVLGCASPPAWQSGFETGFPGNEWLALNDESYTPNGAMPPGRASAWTIVHRESGEPVFAGERAYKGWITSPARESHRAYPGIHADIPTPLLNTFMVYLDADYDRLAPGEWIHFGTWGNHDPKSDIGKWALHTMAVRNRKLEFAHTEPFHGEYIGPAPQPEFPLRRWVRFTIYVIYQGDLGSVQAWQDGVPMLRAQVAQLRGNPGTRLRTAHWGMYASGSVRHGVQYNDEIRICALSEPLADLVREPRCP